MSAYDGSDPVISAGDTSGASRSHATLQATLRKSSQIKICLEQDVVFAKSNGFEKIELEHAPLPEIDRSTIDTACTFCGKKFSAPFLIEAMANVAARGMDRAWTDVQRIIGVGLNEILLGSDVEKTMKDTAGKAFDAAQQTGYTPEKTGKRP